MFAIVPILPVLLPLVTLLGGSAVSLATVWGVLAGQERRRGALRFLWKQKYSLLVIFGVLGGSGYAIQQWLFRTPPLIVSPTPSFYGADWPMFQGNAERSGAVTSSEEPAGSDLLWSAGFQESFWASPAIKGNRIYAIGSQGDNGHIYCWDSRTGDLQWVMRPAGLRATFSSPVVVGNYLLCGEGLHWTSRSRVLCLELQETGPPRLEWAFETDSHVECTPVVVDDRVYVSAGDDGVYALSLHTHEEGSPAIQWHATGDHLPDVETALVADRQSVYVGTGQGGQSLVILDAQTGQSRGRIPFSHPLHAPPALSGTDLYVGMGQGNFSQPEAPGGGAIACIDTRSRTLRWTLNTSATVLGAITVSDKEVIFGAADGLVRVVSPTGKHLRSWDSGEPLAASLAVTPETICGVTIRGRLFVLERPSLTLKWERALSHAGHFISSPVVSNGRIYVGTDQAGLQCLGSAKRVEP